MAKRIIDWKEDGTVLKAGRAITLDEKEAGAFVVYEKEFDLAELFEITEIIKGEGLEGEPAGQDIVNIIEFEKLNKVQKHLIFYGVKQKLADAGSSEKDFDQKMDLAQTKWDLFLKGEIAGARTNSTGAKENKVIAGKVRELVGVVSMEGLFLKKLMNPDSFTEEDEAKLKEFIQIKAEHDAKEQG